MKLLRHNWDFLSLNRKKIMPYGIKEIVYECRKLCST